MSKVQMRAEYPKQKKAKEGTSKLDSLVYWVALLGLSVLSVAGAMYFLQPVDKILAGVFSVSLVGAIFYIAIHNR